MLKRRALLTAALAAPAVLRAAEPRVLRFSWWGGAGRHEATLKAIAAFEKREPGLKVKAEYMGFNGYLERLTTQIAGRAEPDVMQINWAWLAMFSKRGNGFTDLNAYKPLLALDQFTPEDIRMGEVAGKLNALPTSYTARIMLWNQAAWQRAGLALPKTWDELFAAGPVFKGKLGDRAYAIDGELYDMILLSQAWVQQKHGTPYVDPAAPRVANIVLLGITPVSGGNVLGIGFADFIPVSVAEQIDFVKTYINCFTAGPAGVRRSRMPMVLPTDDDCIKAALSMCGRGLDEPKRVVRIGDTLHPTTCWVSDALLDQLPAGATRVSPA